MNVRVAVGCDVGGTKLAAGLVDASGRILARRTVAAEAARGAEHVMARVESLVGKVLAEAAAQGLSCSGIGVGSAGQIDFATGRVVYATPNLPGWTGMPIGERLEAAFGLTCRVDNDGNAAALGEWWAGAGRDRGDLVCMTLGTGIGGGIIRAARVMRGAHGAAAGLGHVSVDYAGPACNCGSRGCIEVYASGPAIARRGAEALRREGRHPLEWCGAGGVEALGPPSGPSARDVFAAARRGDPLAVSVVEETGALLGCALASVANVADPAVIVIGGGVGVEWPLLAPAATAAYRSRALPGCRQTPLVAAQLGPDAGVIGAAALIWLEGS